MSSDKRLNKRVPEWVRREDTAGVRIDSGPFIGIIKNNNDPIRSGRLQVWIPDLGGDEDNPKNWRVVSYASPFYGTTYQPTRSKNNKFEEVKHSYGMWFVPPDVDNQVICTFIAGDPNRGFWFACVSPDLSHHMVPGVASSSYVDLENASNDVKTAYSKTDSNWPVAEFNQNDPANIKDGWVNNGKPPHEAQVNILLDQGLDRDRVRGAITSSSQRETPSAVFGISTPGRSIRDTKNDQIFQQKVREGTLTEADLAVPTRKGGHSFVMDDGDLNSENQLIRLRTAGGHQILMNDTERVLYVANSDGTCWLEFTGGGHINMYSSSGVHIRSEGELDLHSDTDINIEAGNSVKIRAGSSYEVQTKTLSMKGSQTLAMHGGKITSWSETHWALQTGTASIKSKELFATESGKITVKSNTTTQMFSDAETFIDGSEVHLNEPQAAPELVKDIVPTRDLQSWKQTDVTWDSQRGLWARVNAAFETIVPTTPGHEPWTRTASIDAINANQGGSPQFSARVEEAKVEIKQSGICEPQTPARTPGKSVPVEGGGDYEKLVESELRNHGITDNVEIAAIMAQCAHESGNWKYLRELGNDAYFAKYEGRASLGNVEPGDGLKFKGRGFIQITGRDIYTRAGKFLGIDLIKQPELAEDPATAAKLVIYFFFEYKKSATRTINWNDIVAVTRLVNGGQNGLEDRRVKFEQYKQKYVVDGAVTSSNGSIVVDGSGNPVTSGTSKLDAGPESAKGKPTEKPAPPSSMTRPDTPSPTQIPSAGSGILGLNATHLKALMIQIGYYESELDYSKIDESKKLYGRYQINGHYLKQYGYVTDADAVTWSGLNDINSAADWAAATGYQDDVMEEILNDNYAKLAALKSIKDKDDICTVAGMLAVSYFFRDSANPVDKARFWRDQGTQTNADGLAGAIAFNHGRYAIDVLSTVSILTGEPMVEGGNTSGEPPTVDIDPDAVLIFTNRSGDRAHFNASTVEFKNRILQAAKEFKERTGRKLTISSTVRTQEEQTAIYDGWVAAGGRMPERPTVNVNPYGSISRPVKTVGNHGLGIASDIGVADAIAMEQMGILDKYGLYRFDPKGDPPHVQLKPEFRPSGLSPIQSLTKKT